MLGFPEDKSQGSGAERVTPAVQGRALLLSFSWQGQVQVCSPQPHRGKIRSPKHSTAIRTFFLYFLIGSAASIYGFLNVLGVCGYKISHHEVFNGRQTFLQNVENHCSPHKYMKQLVFYGAIHASSSINVFLVNTYSLFSQDNNSATCQTHH